MAKQIELLKILIFGIDILGKLDGSRFLQSEAARPIWGKVVTMKLPALITNVLPLHDEEGKDEKYRDNEKIDMKIEGKRKIHSIMSPAADQYWKI